MRIFSAVDKSEPKIRPADNGKADFKTMGMNVFADDFDDFGFSFLKAIIVKIKDTTSPKTIPDDVVAQAEERLLGSKSVNIAITEKTRISCSII